MSAPIYTLAQLLATQSLDEIRARYLAGLQGAGFPALTEWVPKAGVEMAHVNQVASFITNEIAADLPAMIAGGFLGTQLDGDPNIWLDLLGETDFLLKRNGSSKTSMNWDLVAAAGAGPYTWQPGDLQLVAESANHYVSVGDGPVTAQPGGSVTIPFEAVAAGASYNDDPAVIGFELMTTFAGVSLRVSAPPFSPVIQSGVSTGQIYPLAASGAPGTHNYAIRIDATGDPGTAYYSTQVDGGAFVGGGRLLAAGNRIATDTGAVIFGTVPGFGSPASFITGETFTFATPGGPGYVQGNDVEGNTPYAFRCTSRFASLSLNPTPGLFLFWALRAVPQASRLRMTVDPVIPGRAILIAADAHGPLDPSALSKITAYISARLTEIESFNAVGAKTKTIDATGGVLVTAPMLVPVQQAAQKLWTSYLGTMPIGGTLRQFDLNGILEDAGAIDTSVGTSLELNGDTVDIVLAGDTIPVALRSIIDSLTWIIQ